MTNLEHTSSSVVADLYPDQETIAQINDYYERSQSYLTGPLQGTCHFGYSLPHERYDLQTALENMELLLGMTIDMPPGSLGLDAGFGYGRVPTRVALKRGYKIVGVDFSKDRIPEAQRFMHANGADQSVFLNRGNYGLLPFPDGIFDFAYTVETLCHANPLIGALRELKRTLKPGGKLVLFEYIVPPYETLDPVRKRITDVMVEKTGMASVLQFTRDRFPKILEEAGFENVQVRDIKEHVIPTWRWLFFYALKTHWKTIIRESLKGTLMEYPNLPGSLFIYPYSFNKDLGYAVVTAYKPL